MFPEGDGWLEEGALDEGLDLLADIVSILDGDLLFFYTFFFLFF